MGGEGGGAGGEGGWSCKEGSLQGAWSISLDPAELVRLSAPFVRRKRRKGRRVMYDWTWLHPLSGEEKQHTDTHTHTHMHTGLEFSADSQAHP